MSAISKVIDVFITNGIRFVKLLRFGENDSVNTFALGQFGIDSRVPDNYKALYIKTSNSNEPICIGFINKVILDDLNSGDNQIFSTNEVGDAIASYIKLLNDGTMYFNGDADFITGFNENKIGFDEAISNLNDTIDRVNAITSLLKTWTVLPQDGGLALQTQALINFVSDISNSTSNIDSSKKTNLKTE